MRSSISLRYISSHGNSISTAHHGWAVPDRRHSAPCDPFPSAHAPAPTVPPTPPPPTPPRPVPIPPRPPGPKAPSPRFLADPPPPPPRRPLGARHFHDLVHL